MRNLKLTIEYDGKNYCGWQVQGRTKIKDPRSKKQTLQGVIERTMQKILQEKVKLIASGRTDAGVHALAQVANFKTRSQIPRDKLQTALNGLLPKDISISKIEEVAAGFHSRFAAQSKVYRYALLNCWSRRALARNYAYFYPYPLNLGQMQKEARALIGKHDFSAFCAAGSNAKDKVRRINKFVIRKVGEMIYFDIEADGFLYNMARNIVGTLIEIGRAKFPAGSIKHILRSKDRKKAGPTAPARGLTLIKVKY